MSGELELRSEDGSSTGMDLEKAIGCQRYGLGLDLLEFMWIFFESSRLRG